MRTVKYKFQIIEIDIPEAGQEVRVSTTTEAAHEEIVGVAIYREAGTHGYGTIGLKVAGEEIFTDKFHAHIISLNPEHGGTVIRDVMWPVQQQGKGSQVQVEYKEPENGAAGKLWLYLFAKKCT